MFVTKMPAVRIEDLAHVMIEELAPVHGDTPDDVEVDGDWGKATGKVLRGAHE